VELVGNLKGFPQIHRPGVVLAGTDQTASQLQPGTGAPRRRRATASPVSRSPTGPPSASVRHTLTGSAPADASLAAVHTRRTAEGAACGACGKPEWFSTNPQARCLPGPGAPLVPGGWRAPPAARRPPEFFDRSRCPARSRRSLDGRDDLPEVTADDNFAAWGIRMAAGIEGSWSPSRRRAAGWAWNGPRENLGGKPDEMRSGIRLRSAPKAGFGKEKVAVFGA